MPSPPGIERHRVLAIDATRGAAMLFVCLGHFSFVHFDATGGHDGLLAQCIYNLCKIASPTFMIVSGVTLGVLHTIRRAHIERIRSLLIDRGLFLLTVGHVLIVGAHVPISGSVAEAWRWSFVTDTIGLAVVLGAILIGVTTSRTRLALGLGALALTWPLLVLWHPEPGPLALARETLVGDFDLQYYRYVFPVLPWVGLYLVSTTLGERIGRLLHADVPGVALSVLLLRLARSALALAGAAGVLAIGLHGLLGVPPTRTWLLAALPLQKLPPSLPYLCLFGGFGLLLLRFFVAVGPSPLARAAAVLGRTSLFVFVVQYWAYFALMTTAGLAGRPLAWLYFAGSLPAIWLGAALWDRLGGNRLLTVGWPHSGLPSAQRHPAASGRAA